MGRASRRKRERPTEQTLYHFTSLYHLPSILREGKLRLTDSQIDNHPAVWFLDTPTTEGHDHGLSASITDKTQVRVTVRARAVQWLPWARSFDPRTPYLIGPLGKWLDAVIKTGGGPEAAAHWWVAFKPVDVDPTDVAIRNEAGEYAPLAGMSPDGDALVYATTTDTEVV